MARNGSVGSFDFNDLPDDGGPDAPTPGPQDWALLVLRAALRHKLIFFAVFVAVCAAVTAYYGLSHPMYRVDAKVLAQRQPLPANLRGGNEDNPTITAWELVHRRENLLALIKAAGMVPEEPAKPGLLARLKTSLGVASREPADPLDLMVDKLDRRLKVFADEGTITISFEWPDTKQAYMVVQGALQNFIESRHVQEVTGLGEVIAVLQVRAAQAKEQLERVTADVQREVAARPTRDAASPPPRASGSRGPSEELARLKSLIDGKEKAIEDVDEFRRRKLADLAAQLDEKRHTYSDAHPVVIQLLQDIESLSKESPQVVALREQEAALRKQYDERLAEIRAADGAAAGAIALPTRPTTPQRERPVEEDERVRDARTQYQQITERVNEAQLELDAVRAAFKYRYNVIWPPQLPRDPISPNPVKIFGAGFLAAFLFAFLAAALPDLRSGRIIERWQVERDLRLPILAELKRD